MFSYFTVSCACLAVNRMAEALERAEEYKQRLLRYDRAHKKQTRVIDDESDYYDTNNVWLNHEQRDMVKRKQAEMFEQKYGSRRNKKVGRGELLLSMHSFD